MNDTTGNSSYDHSASGSPRIDWDAVAKEADAAPDNDQPAEGKVTEITGADDRQQVDLVALAIANTRAIPLPPDNDAPPALEATFHLPQVGGIGITVATVNDGGIVLVIDFDGAPRFVIRQSRQMANQFRQLLSTAVHQSAGFYYDAQDVVE